MNTNIFDKIIVSSDLSNLSVVESLVDEVTAKCNIIEDVYGNMLVSITEAFTNAVIHGNKQSESKVVTLEINDDKDKVVYIIQDQGLGFDFNNLPDPTLPENIEKETGRGIFLIKNLADSVDFLDNGRTIKISFNK